MNNTTITIEEKQAIKKAWNQMKKAIFSNNDPLNLKGDMYMTNQQMEKRTATICLGNACKEEYTEKCRAKAEKIINTDAFKKFSEEAGVKSVTYEIREDAYYNLCMYMRINY
jgi:hypothetical protein